MAILVYIVPIYGTQNIPPAEIRMDFSYTPRVAALRAGFFHFFMPRLPVGVTGTTERAGEPRCQRQVSRSAPGRPLGEQWIWHARITRLRCMIRQARRPTLKAACTMDTVGGKVGRAEIAMIGSVASAAACQAIDWTVPAHGGGVSDDFPVAAMDAGIRTSTLADGSGEVCNAAIAKPEPARYGVSAGT